MNRVITTGLAALSGAMLSLSTIPAVAATSDRPTVGDVQAAMTELAKSPSIVGAIGEVYVDGKLAGKGTAGSRLINGKGGKIPSDSRYRLGSQTKQMTGVVILQLVKEGKLKLDDKLSDLLPEVAEKDLVERADEITLQQLIQHTSGIPNWFHPDVVPTFDFATYYSPMELVKRARALPRQQEPGEMFYYSNTNYMLLGLIIEKTTDNSVAAEFKRRIFDPLKMKDTYLPTKFPGGIEGPHGHGYFPGENGKPRDIDRLNMSYGYAAGGVIGTARDISAFHRAFNKNQLLPEELKKVLAGPPRNRQPSDGASPQPSQPSQGGFCGGKIQVAPMRGTAPGFNAMTISTTDGRMQVAISVTLTIPNTDDSLQSLLSTAAEAVFCPKK